MIFADFIGWLSLDVWGLSASSWAMFALVAFVVGFSKAGIPGVTIITVPIMAMIFPPKASVGILLPIFMSADVVSIFSYFRHARWSYCFPYLLFVGSGVLAASRLVGGMTDANFGALIGWVVLLLLLLSTLTDYIKRKKSGVAQDGLPPVPRPPLAESAFFGFFAGLFSAMANSAGPIVSVYLLRARLPKYEFLGTTAFCAFVMNWIKVPLFVKIGIINAETLRLLAFAVPIVILGGIAGIAAARKIPQQAFKTLVILLAYAATIKLILG